MQHAIPIHDVQAVRIIWRHPLLSASHDFQVVVEDFEAAFVEKLQNGLLSFQDIGQYNASEHEVRVASEIQKRPTKYCQ